ncbi:MAG: PA2169 family four-helix-bundle protein [Bacteroidia bacterium]|nr:PA2169 family four-helix-bundle protein [Bacteroidia bacterium]
MENQKSIAVLNTLIILNNDRIEGYETAIKETNEEDLKVLFAKFIQTSQKCKQELVIEVINQGGKVAEGTMTSGKLFRFWMDIKASLTNQDRKAILNSCEYGEDMAVDTYERTIENDSEHLNAEHLLMIKAQYGSIKANHDKVKALRDNMLPTL